MSIVPAMVGALLSATAQAEGYSTDIELLQPTFSVGSIPGVDSPLLAEPGRWRVGLLAQHERDPLVLYDAGNELGAIVQDRFAMQAGLNYTIARRAAVQITAPVFVNSGTQTPDFAAGGAGFGDLSLSGRFQVLNVGPLAAALRLDVTAPTGRKDAYMGEAGLRTGGALLAKLDLGFVEFLADAGGLARAPLETEEDVTFSSEIVVNSGVRIEPLPERLWIFSGALTRGGLTNLWQPDSGENPAELIAGAQLNVGRDWMFEAGAGRGLTDGYGTTEQRLFFGATWQQGPRPEPPPPIVSVPDPKPPPIVNIAPIEEDPVFLDGVRLNPMREQIEIEEPLQFEFNSARLLPESAPTLAAVARILQTYPEIGQLIIEGHASEEGSFEYNYQLSLLRAVAVWEALIDQGVHPRRLGVRGMGEVVSASAGDSEAALARERRVEFHIVQWLDEFGDTTLDPGLAHPVYGTQGGFTLPSPRLPEEVSQPPGSEPIDLDLFKDE